MLSNTAIFLLSCGLFAATVEIVDAIPEAIKDGQAQKFAEFKTTYKKVYANKDEEQKRLAIFAANLAEIEEHNKLYDKKLTTYKKAVNKFADLSKEEFARKYSGVLSAPPTTGIKADSTPLTVPDCWKPGAFKNLTNDAIPIKNQGSCNTCWAFSATGVLEYYVSKKYGINADLSEQMCVDCGRPDGKIDCNRGWMEWCFTYYQQNGVNFECVYPYRSKQETCSAKNTSIESNGVSKTKMPNWYSIPANETLMAFLICSQGWISACLGVEPLNFYASGIIPAGNSKNFDPHAVIFTGYGTDPVTGMDYWIARNSWGTDWGEFGSFRVERNKGAYEITHFYEGYRLHLM